ncbi:phosphotransferase family protein [Parablautia muri]|uniref:Aminoglycoside phosphotransferase family protein n=1 Tax=Parablautia muri TaxID=2320879 RepID=A0A9X5BE31_9FIRM|nr:aminoglycoside phosphotransferase family protein [Parablautia muri]NBJ92039.1 aminoglycoside phosphotransferase family protein [Parablautia muri]
MESLTKNRQDKQTLEQMTAKFFAPEHMVDVEELTEGYFSAAYQISLSSGRKVILKVAPLKEVRIMTYEKNIIQSEVKAMKMVEDVDGILAPKVLGFDDSYQICNSPYFFMEMLPGASLSTRKDTLTEEQIRKIYMKTGQIINQVNQIHCPCFGYPAQQEFQGKEWFPTFQKMLKAGVDDADRGGVDLKIWTGDLWRLLEKDKAIFAEVTEPHLVHWDCWDGNIFVKDGEVTGIIDWERCLGADPLMEVNFRSYGDNMWFLKGYGKEQLTENEKRRALWYDIYLLILMSLECEYRKYDTMDMYHWTTGLLQEQLHKLEK